MSKKPALRPDLAVGEALRDVARAILADARTAIESPDNSDAVAVHEFRREMKHWRALLRLLDSVPGRRNPKACRPTARDIARDLAGARDLQSALDALDDLKEHGLPLPDRSLKTVRKRIDKLRTAGEMNALNADMRLRIAEALADADVAVNRWPIRRPEIHRRRQATGRELSRGARAPCRTAGRMPAPTRCTNCASSSSFIATRCRSCSRCGSASPRCGSRRRSGCASGSASIRTSRCCEALTEPASRWRTGARGSSPPIAARKRRHVAAAKKIATRLFVDKPGAFRRRLVVMWKTG